MLNLRPHFASERRGDLVVVNEKDGGSEHTRARERTERTNVCHLATFGHALRWSSEQPFGIVASPDCTVLYDYLLFLDTH